MNHTIRTGLSAAALTAAVGAAVTLTGCSASQPAALSRPVTTVTVTASPHAAARTTTTGRRTHTSAPVSRPAHTRPATPHSTSPTTASATAPTVAQPAACPNGTIRVTATRGGALPGEEIALLRFTNTSTNACSLTGFPGVELLAGGSVLGRPAVRSKLPMRELQLDPGKSVTARLHDDSRCNAGLSDEVGVYVPNQTTQLTAPLELRACALTIDPVHA